MPATAARTSSAPDHLAAGVRVNSFPERIPVETSNDVVSAIDAPRPIQDAPEEDKNVVIAAAMVNPKGRNELDKEWISLLNVSDQDIDLADWMLEDHRGRKIDLSDQSC